jgi:hypothetical protein
MSTVSLPKRSAKAKVGSSVGVTVVEVVSSITPVDSMNALKAKSASNNMKETEQLVEENKRAHPR